MSGTASLAVDALGPVGFGMFFFFCGLVSFPQISDRGLGSLEARLTPKT